MCPVHMYSLDIGKFINDAWCVDIASIVFKHSFLCHDKCPVHTYSLNINKFIKDEKMPKMGFIYLDRIE